VNSKNVGEEEYDYYSNSYRYTIKFVLTNGDEVYRSYDLRLEDSYELLQNLYDSSEFKEAHFPINTWEADDIGQISIRYYSDILNDSKFGMDGSEGYQLKLDQAEKQKFLETYKEELNNISLDELVNSTPRLSLQMEVNEYDVYNYYVFPSFRKTLAFLSESGFDITKEFYASDIMQIEVYDYSPIEQEDSGESDIAVDSKNQEYIFDDPQEMEQILPHLVDANYFYSNYTILQVEQYYSVYLSVFNEDYGETVIHEYYFKKGEIPEFVMEQLKAED
jgi:hypothetical protein